MVGHCCLLYTSPAAGVQFRIKDADGNWVVQRQLYPSPVDITVFETAADGTLVPVSYTHL